MTTRSWLALSVVLLATACGSSSATGTEAHASPSTVQASEADNGKTLAVHVGDVLDLTVAATWTLTDPPGGVLTVDGQPTVKGPNGHPCSPMTPCDSVTAYKVAKAGTTSIRGTRTSCGEALQCSPDKRNLLITVVAS